MHGFRRLSVWRKAHQLTLRIYTCVDAVRLRYPSLGQQMLRAAHGIPSNIAEGSGSATGAQFARFLQIALGSARELDYFLQLAVDLQAITPTEHAVLEARTDEVTRMLVGLRSTVVRPKRIGKRDAEAKRRRARA